MANRPNMALVLFGPPGSGKGTQAQLLKECLGFPHISTGDMLREHVAAGDDVGQEIEAIMKAGRLVPDEMVNRLLEERIKAEDCRKGFILDGYPRTIQQAQVLDGTLSAKGIAQVVVHLKVDYNKVIARLTGRRQCVVCGTLYNMSTRPPKVPGKCDLDGGELVIREDDRESVIRERLIAYESQTRPVVEYFRQTGHVYHEVDASDDPPRVIVKRICGLIDKG